MGTSPQGGRHDTEGTQMAVISHDVRLLRTMPCLVPPGDRHRLRAPAGVAPFPARAGPSPSFQA
jgi:hypothetical protein